MSFLHNSAGGIWNMATSYLPAPAKYCQDNNITWTTTGNLCAELAAITVWGPLTAVRETGEAAMAAVAASVAHAIPAWVYSARDTVSHAVHCALADNDIWQFGDGASAATLAQRATAAGAKALDLGCGALQGGYKMLCATTDDFNLQLNATLDEFEEKLQWTGIFDEADDAVPSPCFSWEEDGSVLSEDDLQDWYGDDSGYSGDHDDSDDSDDSDGAYMPVPSEQAPTASADDFASARFTGTSAALPMC